MENNRTLFCFRLDHPRYTEPLQFGCESLLQLEEWVIAIRHGQSRVDVMVSDPGYTYTLPMRL